MKYLLPLLLTLLISLAAEPQAYEYATNYCCENGCQKDFYGKILTGANFLQSTQTNGNKTKYDAGYIIAGSLGYYWCYGLRLEGEYAYRNNDVSKMHFVGQGFSRHGCFQSSSYMANLFWDIPQCLYNLHPFLGLGIGYDCQRLCASNSRIRFNQRWSHFSWQLMAGVAYPIFCNTEFTIEYRFHQGGSHFNNHTLGFGIVYHFDWNWIKN